MSYRVEVSLRNARKDGEHINACKHNLYDLIKIQFTRPDKQRQSKYLCFRASNKIRNGQKCVLNLFSAVYLSFD